jgi:hypothetical protein
MDFTWKFTIFFGSAYGSLNIHWDEGPAHAKTREFPTDFFSKGADQSILNLFYQQHQSRELWT